MHVDRGSHNGILVSPRRQAVGVYRLPVEGEEEGELRLAVHLDVTLFVMSGGREAYRPPQIGALTGAPIRHPPTGAVLATIDTYEHPLSHPGFIDPVVRCVIDPGIAEKFTLFDDCLPASAMEPGLAVQLQFANPKEAVVTRDVEPETFLADTTDPRQVPAFRVKIEDTFQNPENLGAAVVLSSEDNGGNGDSAGDARILVGMVLEGFTQPDGSTVLTCYPGCRIIEVAGD